MKTAEPWRFSRVLPIIDGESLDGYIARVAAAHHFPRLAEITGLGGAEVNNRQQASFMDSAGIAAIADCVRIEPITLMQHAPMMSADGKRRNLFGIELAADHFQLAYRRFSPSALKASPHHRALWNLRLFPFCLETWEYLEERCPHPACRRQQRWRRTVGVEFCDFCGEPLSRAMAERVPHSLRENLEHLVGLVHPDSFRRERTRGRLSVALRELEADDLMTFSCMLAAVQDPRRKHPIFSQTYCLDQARTIFVPTLAQTWPLLEGWPHTFEELLTERLNSSANGQSAGDFGAAYHFLIRCKRRRLSAPLRKQIEEFEERCRTAPTRAMNGHEAAHVVGSRVDSLVQLRREGGLRSTLCLDGNRFYLLFDRQSVEELAKRFKPRVRREYLAVRLGIPTYSVRDLVYRGLLQEAPVPPGRTKRLAVLESSADALLASLAHTMPVRTTDYPIKLRKLMYCLGGGPKPWAAILAAILGGELDAALAPGKGPIIERIYLRNSKVITLPMFADRPGIDLLDTAMPKADLADMLSVSRTIFGRYSRYLLGSEDHFIRICPEKALSTAKSIISTTEMAARLQIHHTEAYRLATRLGVSVKRDGLFDRRSAFELIPELDDMFRDHASPPLRIAAIMADEGRAIPGVRGRMRGKLPELSDSQRSKLIMMHATGDYSVSELSSIFRVSKQIVYHAIQRRKREAVSQAGMHEP